MLALRFGFGIAVVIAAITVSFLPAIADSHWPTLDIIPVVTWAPGSDAFPTPGNPIVDGEVDIAGSLTVPVIHQLSASYDHIVGGLASSSVGRVAVRNRSIQPGTGRQIIDNFRLDRAFHNGLNVELGYYYRHRRCCPNSSDPNNIGGINPTVWHLGYLAVTYVTLPIKALNGTTVSYTVNGEEAPHHTTAYYLASLPPGWTDSNRTELGAFQQVAANVPIDKKNGFVINGFYAWGALDFYDNTPFPFSYRWVNVTAIRKVNSRLSFSLAFDNLVQANQGFPFASPQAIHFCNLWMTADIHLAHK